MVQWLIVRVLRRYIYSVNSLHYIGGSDVLPSPLKGKEEQDALEALEKGDEQAKRRLVEHNLRLVVYIARRFEGSVTNIEDLISIGTIGLIKAVGTYRTDKNIKLEYSLLSCGAVLLSEIVDCRLEIVVIC